MNDSRGELERLIRLLRDTDSATKTLASWIGTPVTLRILSREDGVLTDAEFGDLDLWAPDPVQRREVCLLDARGRVLSTATSVVVPGRLPRTAAVELCESDTPLGLVLARLPVRRHTLKVMRRTWPGATETDELFEVTARMDVSGLPVATVREHYMSGVLDASVRRMTA